MYKNKQTQRLISVFLTVSLLLCTLAFSSAAVSAETIGLRAGETYYLRNVATGKYMDVYNANVSNGTNILLYGFNGQNNQRFTVVHKGNGIYRLRPKHANGYTMDVTGSNVDIWQEGSYASEDFTIVRNITSQYPGSYYIKYGSKYVMSSTDENNVLAADTSTYDSKALWSFEKAAHGDGDIYSFKYNNFDTTGADSHVYQCLENRMGYSGYRFLNWTSGNFLVNISADDIVVFNGHGFDDGGSLLFYDSQGNFTGKITGKSIDNLPVNALTSVRVFIACGCSTGKTSSTDGNIINSLFSRGAHFSIGWTETVYTSETPHWIKSFFDKIGDKGATVKDARDHAEYWSHCGGIYYKGDLSQQLSHLK